MKKILILYAYCENQTGILANNQSTINLKYFLDNGLINNDKYLFCININGNYKFDFKPYLDQYSNLLLFKANGTCQLDAWNNIIKNIDNKKNIDNFEYFLFICDKVSGPYNKNKISMNWIDFIIDKIYKNVLICAYGTSPHGKLYKIPYYTMKFFAIDKYIFDFLIDHDVFNQLSYDTTNKKEHDVENIKEIKLSYLFLEHDIKYIAFDINKIYDLDLVNIYKQKKYNELFKITKSLHEINDINMKYRLFWSGNTMRKVFNDKQFAKKILLPRSTEKLQRW